jgi:hypothetical protein
VVHNYPVVAVEAGTTDIIGRGTPDFPQQSTYSSALHCAVAVAAFATGDKTRIRLRLALNAPIDNNSHCPNAFLFFFIIVAPNIY